MMMMRCSLPPMIPVHAKRLPCSFPGDDWKLIENDGEFSIQWRAHCPALHGYLSRATAQSGSYTTQEAIDLMARLSRYTSVPVL